MTVKENRAIGIRLLLPTLLLHVTTIDAAIIRVPGDCMTIQEGIDAVAEGDTVLIAPGTYSGPGNIGLESHGRPFVLRSEEGPLSTIIDCEYSSHGISGLGYNDVDQRLEGITIKRGRNYWCGGGISCSSGATISSCIITENLADYSGGGIACGNTTIRECIISYNVAETYGGGISCGTGNPVINRCIIANNTAHWNGGGLYGDGYDWSAAWPKLTNCTIFGNSKNGLAADGDSYAQPEIVVNSCILWANGGKDIDLWNATAIVKYTDIQEGWSGTGNISSNPFFVNSQNDNFRLQARSPCIDTGDPGLVPGIHGGRRADMGAAEFCLGFNFRQGAVSQTRHVPQDYPTIQEAIDAAVYLDTILVADGTYTDEGNKNIDFLGKTIIVQSENGPEATVIDCENDGRGFYFNNQEILETKLKGFMIINGKPDYHGGGIYCDNSSPSILDCWIIGCETPGNGGGVYCAHTNALLSDCLIAYNEATSGGGLCFFGYEEYFFQIYNTNLTYNDASQKGGAIYCGASSSITNCTMYGNTAEEGSGITFGGWEYDSPIVTNCILWGNPPIEISIVGMIEPLITYSDVAGSWLGEGNIDADPLFLDPENGDFHLTLGSPCIDTGTSVGAPLFDFEGDPRPLGDGYDIGADEYRPDPKHLSRLVID